MAQEIQNKVKTTKVNIKEFISQINSGEFKNVYIYVGDAVRWDLLPSRIADCGFIFTTIAASTSSAPSFSSLLTGLYPPSHGVHSFSNQIPEDILTIHDTSFETTFINSIQGDPGGPDPIYTIQNREPLSERFSFEEMAKPFAVIERGPGGHAPYDSIGDADTKYFESISNYSQGQLCEQYQNKIERDADRFLNRLEELEDAGIREETLVIYTSDHGELLGEGGLLGHNSPMRPELTYVPTVFIHPKFEKSIMSDRLIKHVDLLPTLVDIFDLGVDSERFDGEAITKTGASSSGLSVMKSPFAEGTAFESELFYEGVWDQNGGHVFNRTGKLERLKIWAGKILKSPKRSFLRRHLATSLRSYTIQPKSFGTPQPREVAKEYLPDDYSIASNHQLTNEEKETLHDLGYLS